MTFTSIIQDLLMVFKETHFVSIKKAKMFVFVQYIDVPDVYSSTFEISIYELR